MVVLGIDPGLSVSGFGVVTKEGRSAHLLDYGALKLPATRSLPERVTLFHDFFQEKIAHWNVTHIALETPFLGKNAQNFLKLGYLRGIVYVLGTKHGTGFYEFSPREVKATVTGFGGAQKEQVCRVILRLFPGLETPEKLDVTDALAVTLCGLWKMQQSFTTRQTF